MWDIFHTSNANRINFLPNTHSKYFSNTVKSGSTPLISITRMWTNKTKQNRTTILSLIIRSNRSIFEHLGTRLNLTKMKKTTILFKNGRFATKSATYHKTNQFFWVFEFGKHTLKSVLRTLIFNTYKWDQKFCETVGAGFHLSITKLNSFNDDILFFKRLHIASSWPV